MNKIQSSRFEFVDYVATEYRNGRPLAIFFDYDGTLTPIVRHPSLARLDPHTRELVCRLATMPKVAVGVISGRALHDVKSLVGLDGIYYAGSGGLEIDLQGEKERYPHTDNINLLLDGVQDNLLDLLQKFPGTWMERKPGAIALHFRGLLPLSATCFRLEAVSFLSNVEELRFRVVSEAIEVVPMDGWDKGTAVISILSHMEGVFASAPFAIYFGDAANDAEGMAITTHTGGVSVGIGPDAPAIAEQRLADPAELSLCLDELASRIKAQWDLPAEYAVIDPESASIDSNQDLNIIGSEKPEIGLLLLDPDDRTRTELASGMVARGWQVWRAKTAERAAELLEQHGDAVHVALVDLQLPGLQGARAATEFGQLRPDLIRCFLAADIRPYMAAAFGRLSDVPLFVKPIQAADLDHVFRALVRKKQRTYT